MEEKQKYTSKNTSINSNKLPIIYSKINKIHTINGVKRILDVGGGKFDNAVQYMKEAFDISVLVYDKFNRSEEHNLNVLKQCSVDKADLSIVSNVLNVIREDSVKSKVLFLAIDNTKPEGKVLIKIYEGDKSGIGSPTKKDCWQENKKTKEYHDLFISHPRVKNVTYSYGFATLSLDI